jgi:hypothetical protein
VYSISQLTTEHALGFATSQQYLDEAALRVTTDEIGVTNKYNARIKLEARDEHKYAAEFLVLLGGVAVHSQTRTVKLDFFNLEGKSTGFVYEYVMSDSGMLCVAKDKGDAGYLMGAGRAVDDFLNSVLDTREIEDHNPEEARQLQLA